MKIQVLLNKTSEWIQGHGPEAEIVLTSRVRLARNLKEYPFPQQASIKQREDVLGRIEKAVGDVPFLVGSLFLRVDSMDEMDKQFLVERHLISREHAQGTQPKAVVISDLEVISIMANEEDHLRMQVVKSGFQLRDTHMLMDKLDSDLEKKLDFAFHPVFGYLTACPTNAGTGLRASVLLHLPALVLSRQINQVLQAIIKLGLAVRGLYGEGTEASGNLFQISNQITLGKKEADILDNLEKVIRQIIGHEHNARKMLLKNNLFQLQDRIGRAYGVLKNAYVLSSKEAIELLSTMRMGVDLGLFKGIDRQCINELILMTQPAHLQTVVSKPLETAQRDIVRAELIRKKLEKADRKAEGEKE